MHAVRRPSGSQSAHPCKRAGHTGYSARCSDEGRRALAQPVALKKLDGADFDAMKDRRNVLILPDGFKTSRDFDRIVTEAVNRLTTRSETQPFQLCKDQFNFFSAWVHSPDEDVTILNEVVIGPSDNYAQGRWIRCRPRDFPQ